MRYSSTTELCFATAMSAVPCAKLLGLEKVRQQQLTETAITLVRSLGAFTVLNYDELLEQVLRKQKGGDAT
jgi:hypothetical protein